MLGVGVGARARSLDHVFRSKLGSIDIEPVQATQLNENIMKIDEHVIQHL